MSAALLPVLQRINWGGYHPFYHAVTDAPGPHIRHLVVPRTVREFSDDLDCLLRYFTPVSLDEMVDGLAGRTTLPRAPMLLTVDDGLREIYETMAPMLVKKGVPAAFYLCSAFVDNRELGWKNKISVLLDALPAATPAQHREMEKRLDAADALPPGAGLEQAVRRMPHERRDLLDEIAAVLDISFEAYLADRQPYVTSDEVRSLLERGFAIGAHSVDHPQYSELSEEERIRQSVACMDWLQENFGVSCRTFAHPFSNVGLSARHMRSLFNEGRFELVLGTSSGKADIDPRILQRNPVENRKQGPMKEVISGYFAQRTARRLTGRNTMQRTDG